MFTKFLLGHESTAKLIRDLKRSGGLRRICGLVNGVPSKSTFSRFYGKLAGPQNAERIEAAHFQLLAMLRKYLPSLGQHLAIDGTDIQAHANRFRKVISDPDARFGYRTPKGSSTGGSKKTSKEEGEGEIFLGFKLHTLCDSKFGIPLGYTLHPADVSESTELPNVVDHVSEMNPWIEPHYLTADKAYDGEPNHAACIERGIVPIIDIKKPASKGPAKHPNRHKGGLYAPDGSPTCQDSEHTPMEWVGTVRTADGEIYHEFRCNPEGCPLKARSSGGMLYCNPKERYFEKVKPNNYRMLGPVARANPLWKELYDERTEVERLFSRLKGSRSLDDLTYRTIKKVRVHVGMSVLGYLGTALGHVKAGEPDEIRKMTLDEEYD